MTDLAKIDYQPLRDEKWPLWRAVKWSYGGRGLPIFIIVVVVSVPLMFVVGIGFFVLVGYIILLAQQVQKYKNSVWQSFGAANGWNLDLEASAANTLPASINYGHSQNLSPVILAQFSGLDCDLFAFNTTTGYGKYQETHYFTVAMVKLPSALPHISLKNKKAHADVEPDIADSEKLKLEGNFDDYFNLQVQKGTEIDVLAIITPDVMQTLIDANQKEDIEISGQSLYFIMRSDKRDPVSVQKLLESVTALSGKIMENLRERGMAAKTTTLDAPPKTA